MDFLDPHKKRAHTIRLYIGYALMAIAITMCTIIVLYSSFGYGVDRHTGKIIQNGLVFLASSPSGAKIDLTDQNGGHLPESSTNARITLQAAKYSVTLSKDGYRNWQRSFEIDGGSVVRLDYPLLIPNQLKTTNTQTYNSAPAIITGSPDRHWVLVLKPGGFNQFEVFDASKKQPTSTLTTIPASVLSPGANQQLKVVEWSTDNTHLLLQHDFDGKKEFIIFNFVNPTESVNINQQFSQTPDEVALFNKSTDQVFLLTGGLLQQGVIKDKNITPLLPHVVNFKPHGTDTIEYISNDPTITPGKVDVRLKNNNDDHVLRELPVGTPYLLDLARFDNHWFVVAGAQSENQVYIYEDPITILQNEKQKQNLPARTLRVDAPEKVLFSANAQFISAQGKNQTFAVYDAQTDRQYRYSINKPFDLNEPASWMDGDRLVAISNNQVIMFDFDGNNLQTLNGALSGSTPQFDRDFTAIYNISTQENDKTKFALTRASLRTDQ